jgi:hypothetical protein
MAFGFLSMLSNTLSNLMECGDARHSDLNHAMTWLWGTRVELIYFTFPISALVE